MDKTNMHVEQISMWIHSEWTADSQKELNSDVSVAEFEYEAWADEEIFVSWQLYQMDSMLIYLFISSL